MVSTDFYCIGATILGVMHTQDLCGMLQEKLSCLREMDNTVHGCLEAARTALSASEAWSQAPGLGAALTAADALHRLHGMPCCRCCTLCWSLSFHS